jgi:glycosyltransferase involved in cell wall biosynthesis
MKKVLVISDPAYPLSNTGFGIVAGMVMPELKALGLHVTHYAQGLMPHHQAASDSLVGYNRVYATPMGVGEGTEYLERVFEWEKPDALLVVKDPVTLHNLRRSSAVRQIPTVYYGPTEGAPLTAPWSHALYEVLVSGGRVATYTHFSKQAMEQGLARIPGVSVDDLPPIEILPHGIDHAPFCVLPESDRGEIRAILGWTDKFVVINVARNAARKNWPILFEALALAKKEIPNLLLYAHTLPFENFNLGGHNLNEQARYYGILDNLFFARSLVDPLQGFSFQQMIELYNAADLFVSVSGAEGWNLPLCEAAACGVPTACVSYAGGWEVAQWFARPIAARAFETHASGARWAVPTAVEVTFQIVTLYLDAQYRKALSGLGLEATAKMKWGPTAKRLAQLVADV